jgi:hypothetical protein
LETKEKHDGKYSVLILGGGADPNPPKGFEEVSAQQLADAAEITGLAFDTSSSRIAVCHRKSTVQSYVIDSSLTPRPLFSVSIRNLVPKAVAFGEFKGSKRDVLVFRYHSGEV